MENKWERRINVKLMNNNKQLFLSCFLSSRKMKSQILWKYLSNYWNVTRLIRVNGDYIITLHIDQIFYYLCIKMLMLDDVCIRFFFVFIYTLWERRENLFSLLFHSFSSPSINLSSSFSLWQCEVINFQHIL